MLDCFHVTLITINQRPFSNFNYLFNYDFDELSCDENLSVTFFTKNVSWVDGTFKETKNNDSGES